MQTQSRPIPAFIKELESENDIRFDVDYLGICLIDTYCQAGDMYESWDIVPMNESGGFDRAPDARYGPDAPDSHPSVELQPVRLWSVYQTWDCNGWIKRDESIYEESGRLLCHKEDG